MTTTICETIMLICFGLSWPFAVAKSLKSKTAKGKSIFFQVAILVGYVAGIMGKALADNFTYVFWLYILNFSLVAFDLVLYFRNTELDRQREFENKAMLLNIELEEPQVVPNIIEEDIPAGAHLANAAMESLSAEELHASQATAVEESEGMALVNASLSSL